MNYNPIKLQNDLRLIPTETLIQYVQGMNPEVPSYMALGVLKERKEKEARYNAENQKAPESSVAEDLTQAPDQSGLQMLAGNPMGNPAQQMPQGAPSMPADQGVASLDTGDMYQEDSFAGGGIVAFDDGGDVNYAGGGMVAFGPGGDVASKRYQAALEDSYLSPGSIYAGAKDLLGMPFQYGWTTDPVTGKLVRKKDIEGMTPSLDAYRKAAELRKRGLLAEADTLEKVAASPQVNRPGLAGIDTSTAEPGMTFTRDELADITQSRNFPSVKTETPPPPRATQTAADEEGLASLYSPIKDRSAEIDALIRPTEGMAEERMARYQKMVGDLPNKDKLEALVQKYETGAAEQERTAPWMALAKAGFSMAGGKSPFAIQNLAEGAQTGLADYVQARDRLEKLRDKQIDVQYKLDNAAYERKRAGAEYGMKSEEHRDAKNDEVKLKKIDYQTTRELKNQANKIAAYEATSKDKYHEAYLQALGGKDKNTLNDKVIYEEWAKTGGEDVHGPFDQYRTKILKDLFPMPKTTADYAKLKSGETYIDPQGTRRIKP
jgi:hypothetical protein